MVKVHLHLDGAAIPWEDKWVYLGMTLKSGKSFSCCVKDKVSSFYRCLNSIIRIDGRSDDELMLRLLETHCLPILTYGLEILYVSDRDENRQPRVAYNSIYRKIFGYSHRESVTIVQHALERPTWEELTQKRKDAFEMKCKINNPRTL